MKKHFYFQCSLLLLKKTCTEAGVRNICTNHFGKKCYSYIYPRVTTTVETKENKKEVLDENDPNDDAERINTTDFLY